MGAPYPSSLPKPVLACLQGPHTVIGTLQPTRPCWSSFRPREAHTGPAQGDGLQERGLCRPEDAQASLGRSSGFPGPSRAVWNGRWAREGPRRHGGKGSLLVHPSRGAESDGRWKPDSVSLLRNLEKVTLLSMVFRYTSVKWGSYYRGRIKNTLGLCCQFLAQSS